MTQEDKQLLLKDLCARLPYGVIIDSEEYNNKNYRKHYYQRMNAILTLSNRISCIDVDDYPDASQHDWKIDMCKPYLRPMSSMTEEEIEMYFRFRSPDTIDVVNPHHCCGDSICAIVDGTYMRYWYSDMVSLNTIDYLNSTHLDWRGLIDINLAVEAPEGMYNLN